MTAQSFGNIAGKFLDRRDPDRPKTHVLRNSYDVDDPRAQVFKKVGNGTKEHGWAHVGALLETCDAIFEKQRSGRHRGHDRLQPLDRHILKTLLKHMDFATGALFPAHDTIATLAGVARQSVVNALKRLTDHKLILWIRRSQKKEGAEHQAGPQREQTSNAYYFDLREMARAVRKTFLEALSRRLKKHGKVPANLASGGGNAPQTTEKASNPDVEQALSALGKAGDGRWSASP